MTPAHIVEAFRFQAKACENLGSPFMGQLMRLFAERDWPAGAIRDRIFAWEGDISPGGQSIPLRLAGALHALHLADDPLLAEVYPPANASDDALWQQVSAALVARADLIDHWLNNAPQTNEVRRSTTLIAVGHVLAHRYGLPITTSELGASGGLNLHWDAYTLEIEGTRFGAENPALTLQPDWTGPQPPTTQPEIAARAGIDISPLDPHDPEDAMRLQAYLWPDQPDRLKLTRAAMNTAATRVDKGDAIDWLAGRMGPDPGQTHLIYSTVAWQYFPKEKQEEGAALIAAAGAVASETAPIAWFGMEADGIGPGAALTLRLWPGDITLALGRADFHGRWIRWAGAETGQPH
ncbi:MAG: DUF2332 family protein [Pseudomonadota bacterium]